MNSWKKLPIYTTRSSKHSETAVANMTITNNHHLLATAIVVVLVLLLSSTTLSQTTNTKYFFPLPPLNPRLDKAYFALQAWKHAITCDPKGFTLNWYGPNVCKYTGVYCAPAPDDPCALTVAGIDLNHGSLCGTLPEDLGLLSDLAVFHINSNYFEGGIPASFACLKLLHELDVSNNKLDGPFPSVVLELPSLRYLDVRFNRFCGDVPSRVFDLQLDALFINDNHFTFSLPDNLGNSPVSVLVIANNHVDGCLPKSILNMSNTLNEFIIMNSGLKSCILPDIGKLNQLTVLDVSFNELAGPLPESIGNMRQLEQLDVAHNKLSGEVPAAVCELPRLQNFTFSYNYFCSEPKVCMAVKKIDDTQNCIPFRPKQRSPEECHAFLSRPTHCDCHGCIVTSPPSAPPPPYHY